LELAAAVRKYDRGEVIIFSSEKTSVVVIKNDKVFYKESEFCRSTLFALLSKLKANFRDTADSNKPTTVFYHKDFYFLGYIMHSCDVSEENVASLFKVEY
jgi:hypothetical protein